jgi:hypothetical protein
VVEFEKYEYPFAHYGASGDLPARVLLISQKGDRDSLHGLFDIMQTLEIVPQDGPRNRDGDSFVLGGLLNSEERESLSKIPFVGDIPILGALFRHTETQRNKTELVIVAKVNLVKPIQSDQVVIPQIQRTSTLERFFALDAVPEQAPLRQWLRKGGFIQ